MWLPASASILAESEGLLACQPNLVPPDRFQQCRIGGSDRDNPTGRELVEFPRSAERSTQMTNFFPVNTIASAPERSRPALQQLQSAFGMLPNIAGAMSTSPVLINSLVGLFQNVHGGSFTEAQIQILLLTNAVTNACAWAVAFHTALALKEGLEPEDVQAIRERRLPKDSKLAALSTLAKTLIEKRGRLDDQDVDRFIAAGFGKDLALEVIAVIAASTITNYAGSVTKTPLEAAFQAHAWSP
jgi:AhpD family alkylhydroperoxidase